jgi:anti-sigma B factor antagonist
MPIASLALSEAASTSLLRIEKGEGFCRLSFKADLVASNVEYLRERLQRLADRSEDPLVIDLSSTRQIDSLGLALLLSLFKTCSRKGLGFSIEGANTDIIRVFRLFNLTRVFAIKGA